MNWSDEQIKIILKTFLVVDGGCRYCITDLIYEFIKLNDSDEKLLAQMKSNFEPDETFEKFPKKEED